MTTIVYKDGLLVADSRAYGGQSGSLGMKVKIRRLGDGSLVGVSTTVPGLSEAVMEWFESNRHNDCLPNFPEPNFTALHIDPVGSVYFYNGTYMPAGPIWAPFYAIGSGEDIAKGALEMGADPIDALRCAIKHDPWTDYPIMSLNLHDEEPIHVYEAEWLHGYEKTPAERAPA